MLLAEGLGAVLGDPPVLALPRPSYSPDRQPGTGLFNGHAARAFGLELADVVERALQEGAFPLVLGGDCSILLGALAGVRRTGPVSLVHLDGHSDFRHPGNYDTEATLGAIAGMDLALATGRGEAIMTDWPDVADTAITRIDVFDARYAGPSDIIEKIRAILDRKPSQPFWLYFDVDVLDQVLMPAVDSPGSPGIDPEDLSWILRDLVGDDRCCGMTVTVFDPELDPDRRCADLIVGLLGSLLFPPRRH